LFLCATLDRIRDARHCGCSSDVCFAQERSYFRTIAVLKLTCSVWTSSMRGDYGDCVQGCLSSDDSVSRRIMLSHSKDVQVSEPQHPEQRERWPGATYC
jgi:hypothetical protein